MSSGAFTLPQLSKLLEVQYRTLHSWVERGLLEPSVQKSSGTGTPNLFDERDAVTVCVLVELRRAGVKFELLAEAANRLREHPDVLEQDSFLLVNGDVRIVFDVQDAAVQLERGGLTLAYNTESARHRVRELIRD